MISPFQPCAVWEGQTENKE